MFERNGYLSFDTDDIKRYEDLKSQADDIQEHLVDHHGHTFTDPSYEQVMEAWDATHEGDVVDSDSPCYPFIPLDDDDLEFLASIDAFADAMGDYSDWEQQARYGETFVSENEWQDYAQQTAEDVGMVDTESAIYNYIDWEKWAEALQQDYTVIEVDSGEFRGTWYYRG